MPALDPAILSRDDQSAQPGDFRAYVASRDPQATTPVVASAEPAEPPVETGPEQTDPAKAESWEDPETHDQITRPTRADKRIKRLWTEREQERQRAAKLEQELSELRAQFAEPAPAAPVSASAEAAPATAAPDELTAAAQARIRAKPDRAAIGTTYATYEDYVEDCAVWGGELAAEKRQIREEAAHAAAVDADRQRNWREAYAEARPAYDDFDAVTNQPLPISQPIWDAVMNAPKDLAGHVVYYLGKHPDELAAIAALPPGSALMAMGEVLATVRAARAAAAPAATPAPKPQPRSQAPAPLEPVSQRTASTSRSADIAATQGSALDFIRLRNEETRRRV